MDEKLMMREQERLAQEKKRKKNKKKLRIVGSVLLVLVVAVVWYIGWGRNLGDTEDNTVQIVTTSGQKIIYADLVSVKGNEITYLPARMQENGEDAENRGEDGRMPQMGGEMPDMSRMPQMGGEMPNMNRGMRQNQTETSGAETFTYNNVVYEVTDESVTTLIPVGTDVTTKLGTVTTFSRLAAGDKVALVVEEDGEQMIVAVYIIE